MKQTDKIIIQKIRLRATERMLYNALKWSIYSTIIVALVYLIILLLDTSFGTTGFSVKLFLETCFFTILGVCSFSIIMALLVMFVPALHDDLKITLIKEEIRVIKTEKKKLKDKLNSFEEITK